jgi:hypothetical protein
MPNKTQNAVIFPAAYFYPDAVVRASTEDTAWRQRVPPELGYILSYNLSTSLEGQTIQPDFLLEAKLALDAAILRARSGLPSAGMAVSWRHFPQIPSRLSVYNVMASDGGVWLYLPACMVLTVLMHDLVAEKAARVRLGVRRRPTPNISSPPHYTAVLLCDRCWGSDLMCTGHHGY